jgi:phosphatidylserine decarboxylase
MSVSYPHPIIAREGWSFLAAAVAVAAAVGWLIGWWSTPFWLAALFVLQFFRDPPRQVPGDAHTVVSPADGRVVAVERARDPYLERNAIKVSVFMNVFNVHSNRSPVDGLVQKRWYIPGRFINAAFDKASLENERNALWLRTRGGQLGTGSEVRLHPLRLPCGHLRPRRRESRGCAGRQGLRDQYGDCYAAASCLSLISADRC